MYNFLQVFLITTFCLLSTTFASATALCQDTSKKISLLFVGDIMGHGPQVRSAEILRNKVYDYDPCFKYVKPIIKQADLAIGNLEVTLPGKAPYQGYPQFRSPDDLALALRSAGFDLLVTANNHSNDAGKTGVINTINTLQSLGFYQTGTFKNKEDRKLFYPLVVYKNGFKLAFLNYTYDTNGIKTKPPTIVNEIDENLIRKDLAYAQQFNADAIIVVMHWGDEYQLNESREQRKLATKIFEWGADIIIGAHPHVVQPIKTLTIKKEEISEDHLVVYSLGNFISNQKKPNTNGGLMFELELEKKPGEIKTTISRQSYIPVWRYRHKDEAGKITFQAIPISAFEEDETNMLQLNASQLKEMKTFAKKTRAHLNKYNATERIISFDELNLF